MRKLNYLAPIQETIQEENKKFYIKGVAINETITRNGTKYVAEELQKSAHTLKDKPILKDHNNSVDSIVGRTTENVSFDTEKKAIIFEAQIMDEKIKEMIIDGRIKSVSIGATAKELVREEKDDIKSLIVKGIDFVELSLVAVPADPEAGLTSAMEESYNLQKMEENKMSETTESKETILNEAQKLSQELEQLRIEKMKLEKELLAKQVEALKTPVVVAEEKPKTVIVNETPSNHGLIFEKTSYGKDCMMMGKQ